MAFADFTFPQVQQALGLVVNEADLFSLVPALQLREDFVTTLSRGTVESYAEVRKYEYRNPLQTLRGSP